MTKPGHRLAPQPLPLDPFRFQSFRVSLSHGAIGAIAGFITALAAPPTSLSPLAWFGLIPLWLAVLPAPAIVPKGVLSQASPLGQERRESTGLGSSPGRQLNPGQLNPGRSNAGQFNPGQLNVNQLNVNQSQGWSLEQIGTTAAASLALALGWGLAYYGWLLHWLTGLHPLTWMGVPWLGSVAIAGGAWAVATAWQAVAVVLWVGLLRWGMSWIPVLVTRVPERVPERFSERLQSRPVGVWIVGGVALWNGLQTLLHWTPLAWGSLALTQSPHNLPLLHLGQISGQLTVDGAIVAVNGLWAWGWRQYGSDRQGSGVRTAAIALGLWLGVQGLGWGMMQRAIADDPHEGIRVGIIQGNIPTRLKLTPEGIAAGEKAYVEGYQSLGAAGAEVVLLPEGGIPVVWEGLNRAYSKFYGTVRRGQIPAWVGTFLSRSQGQIRGYSQSLVDVAPGGQIAARYDKVKLVPLGEYIPLTPLLGRVLGRLSPIESVLLPGTPPQVFETHWGAAAIAICYEPFFPHIMQQQVAAGGRFLLTTSNLDPYGTVLMAQHEAQDVVQAIALDRWVVRATNTGYSGFITPQGRRLRRSQPQAYATLLDTIYPRDTQTPYGRWGDWLTPTLVVVAGGAWLGFSRVWY
ncbi:apolipoprotein N-acyltransferase [Prochlorothrix hollandica]|uniref:apolipoprotein N-acyltransferase n=1 Tax=Prochlorothrix hollandica TaxID=1223 RepID=UPI00034543F8|nr:apolipoprotein N-acyltransferase [Prochlorothrix hollandica]